MDVDKIAVEYLVPMQSMAHFASPNFTKKTTFNNTKEDVINEMTSNATGSENVQVKALEKEIEALTKEQVDLGQKIVTLNAAYNSDAAERQKLYDLLQTCEWQGTLTQYKCSGTRHTKLWYGQQTEWLNTYWQRMEATKANLAIAQKRKDEIDKLLPQKQAELEASRTSASRAAMTPEELKQYDAEQTKAKATADAIKAESEAKAKATATKSKVVLAIGVVLAIAIIGGGIIWIVKRKPKTSIKPAPVVK